MAKDKLKTFMLIFLVSVSLFFTKQIWFSEKLWSSDYNFFAKWESNTLLRSVFNRVGGGNSQRLKTDVSKERILNPQKFVVNIGGKKAIFRQDDRLYDQMNGVIKDIYTELLENTRQLNPRTVDEEEWFEVLRSKSLYAYIDFGIVCNIDVLGQILGIENTQLANHVQNFRESIIVPGDSISDDIVIYIREAKNIDDPSDDVFSRINFIYDKTKFGTLKELEDNDFPRYTFSFEQEFHRQKATSQVVIAPHVLIPSSRQYLPILQSYNMLDIENDRQVENILEAFDYSTNTLRQYREADGTLLYVENSSKLNIYPDGRVEYKAVEAGKGLKLKEETGVPTLHDSLRMAMELMEQVGLLNHSLHLTSHLVENGEEPGAYTFNFGYFYNGYPITMIRNNKPIDNPVQIKIVNGTLQYYYQYAREYMGINGMYSNVSMLNAVDGAYGAYEQDAGDAGKQMDITNITLRYFDKGNETKLLPKWSISVKDVKDTYVVPAVK
ncbi:MAG: hypothetical protein MJB12_18635 [Firmicutes bacterium]|nr:hypothetical protein [Bacillota bacterium]